MNPDLAEIVEAAVRRALDDQTRSPWKDTGQAADYLSCSPGTLKTWRARGEGPAYRIINDKLVRYNVSDLDAFVRGEVAR